MTESSWKVENRLSLSTLMSLVSTNNSMNTTEFMNQLACHCMFLKAAIVFSDVVESRESMDTPEGCHGQSHRLCTAQGCQANRHDVSDTLQGGQHASRTPGHPGNRGSPSDSGTERAQALDSDSLEFKSQFCHLFTVCPWANDSTSLSFCSETEIPTSQDCHPFPSLDIWNSCPAPQTSRLFACPG